LFQIARAVADQADTNPDFREMLLRAIHQPEQTACQMRIPSDVPAVGRGKNRRAPAVLNPIEVVREGEAVLRSRLAVLTLDQLRDIVAEHGLDPGRLVMKWKTPERVIDWIIEKATVRSRHGDAFR